MMQRTSVKDSLQLGKIATPTDLSHLAHLKSTGATNTPSNCRPGSSLTPLLNKKLNQRRRQSITQRKESDPFRLGNSEPYRNVMSHRRSKPSTTRAKSLKKMVVSNYASDQSNGMLKSNYVNILEHY